MTSHPKGPADPSRPRRNRHIVERAARGVDNRGSRELMERDALRVLTFLGEAPLRTITGDNMRAWVKAQDPPWTPGYWRAIQAMVQDQLAQRVSASGQDVKARLLDLVDHLLPHCQDLVIHAGETIPDPRTPEFKRWRHLKTVYEEWQSYDRKMDVRAHKPDDGTPEPPCPRWERLTGDEIAAMDELHANLPLLTGIDHKAVQGYLKLYAQITGVLSEKHQHLHLHRAIEQGGDLSAVPEAELVEAMKVTVGKESVHA